MKVEKHEMTVRELGSIIIDIISLLLFIGLIVAPFLWLLGIV